MPGAENAGRQRGVGGRSGGETERVNELGVRVDGTGSLVYGCFARVHGSGK